MAGIYIHIPFCKSRCIYCGFYSTTALDLRQRYVDALCREMEERSFPPSSINTIYLGGGTPSQLTIPQLRQLFIYINKVYGLPFPLEGGGGRFEVTIECNPDDVTDEFAEGLKTLPVNRVSMGVQTFNDGRLQFLHRRHTAAQAKEAVERLRKAGIRNISIDLMYGFPGETLDDWLRDIEAAIALNVEHLSAYCLMIEEDTPLYQLRMKNVELREAFPSEELERQMYYMLIDRLEAAGYEHYEISNWNLSPRPLQKEREPRSYRSIHNSNYWNGTPYIGLGAAAHSYDGLGCRRWNVSDIHQYIEGIENGQPCFEQEQLDDDTRYNDTITTALRTREGLDLTLLSDKHRHYCLCEARRSIDSGLLRLSPDHHLSLTREGLFVSDMVMSDLIII